MRAIFEAWMETIFPPFCIVCKERCQTRFFCADCWGLCAPPDPKERCPHCFELAEGLCPGCIQHPTLLSPRAFVFEPSLPASYLVKERSDLLASFAMLQWAQLDWLMPDAIIPLGEAKKWVYMFGEMVNRPLAPLFKRGRCDSDAIERDQTLLLIDGGNSIEEAKYFLSCLEEAFPKKVFLLSLFPYAHSHFSPYFSGCGSVFGNAHHSSARGMDCPAAGKISSPS